MPSLSSDDGLIIPSSSSSEGSSQDSYKPTASGSEDGHLPSRLAARVQALRSKPSLTGARHVPTPPCSFDMEDLYGYGDSGHLR